MTTVYGYSCEPGGRNQGCRTLGGCLVVCGFEWPSESSVYVPILESMILLVVMYGYGCKPARDAPKATTSSSVYSCGVGRKTRIYFLSCGPTKSTARLGKTRLHTARDRPRYTVGCCVLRWSDNSTTLDTVTDSVLTVLWGGLCVACA